MKMLETGRSTGQKVVLSELWIHQYIVSGELKLIKVHSDDMISDGLTKPLEGERFLRFKRKILNLQNWLSTSSKT